MRARFPFLLVVLALLATSCGDDASEPAQTPSTGQSAPEESEPAPPVEDAASAGYADVDFEVFSSDEGAGCAVYVSVAQDEVTDDLRGLIWSGVVAQGFRDCGFSDVVEVGLLTVNGLDSYNQPDFAQTIEHGYFAVDGWDSLVADCYMLDYDASCAAMLQDAFTE